MRQLNMRILSGKYKGRIIKMPAGIRPIQDKVRKSLFDILKDAIVKASFLDLFSGSGIVGIEALSRGAKKVFWVENDPRCIKIIEDNLASLGYSKEVVIGLDVFKALEKFQQSRYKFDFIYFDPPYYQDLAKKTLQSLSTYDILNAYGLAIAQHDHKETLPEVLRGLTLWRKARYGQTILSFYRKQSKK